MQLPSVDVFIGLFFLAGIVYGFLLQREKTITTLCSVYIGLVVASSFSQTIFEFFNGNKVIANQIWIRGNASTSTIAISLLLITTFFVSGAINSKNKKSEEISIVETVIYSALIVALILSSVLGFLPEATRNSYIHGSKLAKILYDFKTLFVIVPPIMLVVLNWKKKEK
jgi:quinol-cytochrome oxidoreductase complex cytochrome b subunit